MKHLEEDIEELLELNKLREYSAEMRNQGREHLLGFDAVSNQSSTQSDPPTSDAIIVKALFDSRMDLPPNKKRALENLVKGLEGLSANEILHNDPDEMAILRAARTMQALDAAPCSAFSKSVVLFYYQIIRELYTADAPDWRIGGARAGGKGIASAYVTGECIRAILGFARTLENTGRLIEGIREIRERRDRFSDKRTEIPDTWRAAERMRLDQDFYTTILRLSDNIALKLGPWPQDFTSESINSFLDEVPKRIELAVGNAIKTFDDAKKEIGRFRKSEAPDKSLDRSATGHAIAMGAIEQAVQKAYRARGILVESGADFAPSLRDLAAIFRKAAQEVTKLIYPAQAFLSAILDRELTAAGSSANPGWDPGEMAFAAASYGFATGSWDNDRLRQAGLRLSETLSERGRFPAVKPFWIDSKGNHRDMLGVEVLRAFSQVLHNVPGIPVHGSLIRRILLFFEDTRKEVSSSNCGWYPDQILPPPKPQIWVTGLAVLALDRINRMLDDRINAQIFRHFTVRNPASVNLRTLYYPDYGLRLAPDAEHLKLRRDSVAIHLERMRAHVTGISLPNKVTEPLFSMVLHGPPGTGKTTLVEALAASCNVPLVEVTPSDIVLGGAEEVERRARAVFEALALLTRAVILFDEFDPVLRRRNPDDTGPSTVFSFLTPGMLPKLKNLHEKAKKRGVAYALITNLIGTLDEAAVRVGRFDCMIGIYPPDPLSRAGRLINEILAFQAERRGRTKLSKASKERLLDVVQKTAGAPIGVLSREGWFVRPKLGKRIPPRSPFSYILEAEDSLEIDWPEAEAELKGVLGEGRAAVLEYYQWRWIQIWDERLKRQGITLQDALQAESRMPPPPEGARATPVSLVAWNLEGSPAGPVPGGPSGNGNGRRGGRGIPTRPAPRPRAPSPG